MLLFSGTQISYTYTIKYFRIRLFQERFNHTMLPSKRLEFLRSLQKIKVEILSPVGLGVAQEFE